MMNAHKFVADKGIEEAKRVLDRAHWENIAYSNGFYYSQSCSENDVNLGELKQVVESVYLVNEFDDLEQAKSWLPDMDDMPWQVKGSERKFMKDELKQSIADYELVQAYKNGEA